MADDVLFSAEDADTITPNSEPQCAVCSVPLEWSGKGFRPKYCADHKRGGKGRKAAQTPVGKRPAAPRNNAAVSRAVDSLELLYGMVGTGVAMTVSPKIGAALVNDREKLAESYRMLLENNARVRKWFAETESKAAWLPILVVHADLLVNAVLGTRAERAPDPAKNGYAPNEPAGVNDASVQDGLFVPQPDGLYVPQYDNGN